MMEKSEYIVGLVREQKEEEYKETLAYLRKGYSIKATAKLTNTSESTVQRLKKDFSL